jgi:hypothetical protein
MHHRIDIVTCIKLAGVQGKLGIGHGQAHVWRWRMLLSPLGLGVGAIATHLWWGYYEG